MKTEVKWMSLENFDATAVSAEHGYVACERKTPYIGEKYMGNKRLCNKRMFCSDDGEGAMQFDLIEYFTGEPSTHACKMCLKIYNKMLNKESDVPVSDTTMLPKE
jgi:hypothetical protein